MASTSASADSTQIPAIIVPAIPKVAQFPPHNGPRVWFMTDGLAPIAIALARELLTHGDSVIVSVLPAEFVASQRGDELRSLLAECAVKGWSSNSGSKSAVKTTVDKFKVIACDCRQNGQCQVAIAEAMLAYGRIDVLLSCMSNALIGAVEELSQSTLSQSLVREQLNTNFFAAVNMIKAVLPGMRERSNGHIIALSSITAHLGTPGLGIYCSSQWALEGYCDSLAYEVAPFNIKMTIVQPNIEVSLLTNKITTVPPLTEYHSSNNPAPLFREILGHTLDKLDGETPSTPNPSSAALSTNSVSKMYPNLNAPTRTALIQETVFAIAAIGGHDNPPSRHIVGAEGVMSVKEKLKTVSEELEDFVDVSAAVDISKSHDVY